MRIGIVTDIHDEVKLLAQALAALRAEHVDEIVTLGDSTDLFGKWNEAQEVADLFRAAGVVGVWGNHDHGLCRNVKEETQFNFHRRTLDYFATLQPRLELGGCHFSHIEPFLDPELPGDLWTFEGRPEDEDRAARSFAAFPHRAAFIGHFHRWLAMTDGGREEAGEGSPPRLERVEWDGTSPLHFEDGKRYLVVVAPLFRGEFAIIDTDCWILDPRKLPPRQTVDLSAPADG